MHCRACQKWLFLAASQWFISSFISCLANISRVLSNPGRLDTLLFWFFPHCLNSLRACCSATVSLLQESVWGADVQHSLNSQLQWRVDCIVYLFLYWESFAVWRTLWFFLLFFVYSYVLISSVGQPCYISEITGKRRRERWLIRRKRNRERCISRKNCSGWREIFFYETVKKTV